MTKSLHPGAAARVGLTAALMAKHGYTASERALEAPRGLLQTYSAKCDWREIHEGLGERFEIATNTYKPFACGIVIHPSIDGCIQLRDELRVSSDAIERVELVVHPLVLELTGKRMGDFFQVDAGQVKTRVYEVAGTRATIFLTGDSNITQVFVRLLGS